MKNTLFWLVLCALSLSACSTKELFTQSYRERISGSARLNIEKIQYYNDRDIRLVYVSKIADETISGGKVEFKDGYYIYTIEIKRGTPCIGKASSMNSRSLKVYFEQDNYLMFRNFRGDPHYQLAGERRDGVFQVKYEGKWFTTEEGGGARLLFVKNRTFEREEQRRRAKGLKVE